MADADAFKLCFFNNVPRVSESEPSRVAFHHKLIQEFLVAWYVANLSTADGKRRLLPSQKIIPFSASLSPDLKIYLQSELQEILGNWEQKHNINALMRCQFLFALVQEYKDSQFDLPTHIHLDLRSYKSATSSTGTIFRNFFQKVSPIQIFRLKECRVAKCGDTNISSERFKMLFHNVCSRKLEALDVSSNPLRDSGMEALAQLVTKTPLFGETVFDVINRKRK